MLSRFSKSMNVMIIIYMTLPIIIFFLGWVKLGISIPFLIVMIGILFKILRNHESIIGLLAISKKEIETMILAFLIIALWVYFSGIGKLVFQNSDHLYRNGIFEMLVNNKWPIIKQFELNGSHKSFLFVYYIGFWLPAAEVGKLFGLTAGYCFQVVWATVGIWMFYYLTCCYLKRVSLIPLVVFIFFSGLDVIGSVILSGEYVPIFSSSHLEYYCGSQFSSFTTQLFWVFNQAIPAWILVMIILMQKNNKNIVFWLGVSLIFCPLPFMGIMPLVIYVLVRNALKIKSFVDAWKDLFTIENILGGGFSGICTYLYLKTNSSGQHIVFLPSVVNDRRGLFFEIILFIILEVGVYIICIYKYQKKNPLLYISFFFLCTCPLIQIGYSGDYCMRASIPCEVMLFLLVMETIMIAKRNNDIKVTTALTIILIIGAVTPIHEISRTIQYTENKYINGNSVYAETYTEEQLMMGSCGDNFRGEVNNGIFVKCLMK